MLLKPTTALCSEKSPVLKEVEGLAYECGARLMIFPPYSPEIILTEAHFGQLKH